MRSLFTQRTVRHFNSSEYGVPPFISSSNDFSNKSVYKDIKILPIYCR